MDKVPYTFNNEDLSAQVERTIHRLEIEVSDNLEVIPRDSANIAVVQLELQLFEQVEEFVLTIHQLVANAVNQRAHMVCFPALTSWLALPFSPRFHRLLPSLQEHLATGAVNPYIVADMLSACSTDMMDVYVSTMSQLARHHGIYIMAGSSLYYEMHQAYHRAFLFDNFGIMAGVQDKLLPSFLDSLFRVEPAVEVKVFETLLGNVALLTTNDAATYEPARIATNLGADLLLCPNLFIGQQTPMDAADGINLRVMENDVYAVSPTLVGETGLGFSLGGKASVYAPPAISLSPKTDSTLMTSGTARGTRLFVESLDFELLKERKSPLREDKNPAFVKEYLKYFY